MRELSEQERVRREKLEEISNVCNPYPAKYERTNTLKEAKNLEDGTKDVKVCGRVGFARKMGKLSFVKIKDIEDSYEFRHYTINVFELLRMILEKKSKSIIRENIFDNHIRNIINQIDKIFDVIGGKLC